MFGQLLQAGSSLLGGLLGRKSGEDQAKRNEVLQRQFAQKGIQWKVADAKAAGVHPLYALGAQTHSFSPTTVGDPLPGAIADMGQDIGRAVDAGMNSSDRSYRKAVEALTLKRMGLENEVLATKLVAARQPSIPPSPVGQQYATGLEGQGDATVFTADPRVANVAPPSANVETVKAFGSALMRNPRLFSSAQTLQDEFGEGAEWMIGIPALVEAFSRSLLNRNLSDVARGREIFGRR